MKNPNQSSSIHSSFVLRISILLLFSTLSFSGQSQSLWLPNATDQGIGVELLKPIFEDGDEISFFTSVQTIYGRFRLSDNILLHSELPFALAKSDLSDGEFGIGNPYLGIVFQKSDRPYYMEVGLRAPLASEGKESALFVGAFSDYDRAEAFLPDMFSISLKNNYLKKYTSNFIIKFMGGLSLWVPTSDDNFQETEVLMDYSGHAGYDGSDILVLGGFTGRLIFTEDDLDFGERAIHQFGVFARIKSKNVQPGFLIRIPLDEDLSDFINLTLGFNLLVNLN